MTHTSLHVCSVLGMLLAMGSIESAPARAQASQGSGAPLTTAAKLEPSPCPIELLPEWGSITCAFVAVPESYVHGTRTIQLAVLIARADRPSGKAPVLYLAGGPGYSGIADAPYFLSAKQGFGALRATRDLIFVDQRGTGFSRPSLLCPELENYPSTFPPAALRACHARLRAEGVNLSSYRTDFSSLDLNRVRVALGLAKLSIYGGSYGAKLGLQRLRGSPAWLESVALVSPIDPLVNTFADSPRAFQQSLEALDQACAEQPRCLATYGHLRDNVETVVDQLVAAPREVAFTDLRTGQPQTLLITAALVSEGLYEMLAVTEFLPFLPSAFQEAADGSFQLLASLGYLLYDEPGARSEGMALSIHCAEEFAYASPSQFRASARGTDRVVHEHFLPLLLRGFEECEAWPVPPSTPLFHLPVISGTATLLVAGGFDSKTPGEYAEGIARFLRHEQRVEIEHASHSSEPECLTDVLSQFFADSRAPLDEACAARALTFAYREPAEGSPQATVASAGRVRVKPALRAASGATLAQLAGAWPSANQASYRAHHRRWWSDGPRP